MADDRPWTFARSVQTSPGLNPEKARPFALALLQSNATARGLLVDAATLTAYQDPAFPGDPTRRVWKAKAQPQGFHDGIVGLM